MDHYYWLVRPREWVRGHCDAELLHETHDMLWCHDGYFQVMEIWCGAAAVDHYMVKESK